jgi:hypothetical protein
MMMNNEENMNVKTFSSKAQMDRFLEYQNVVVQDVKRVFDRSGFVWIVSFVQVNKK